METILNVGFYNFRDDKSKPVSLYRAKVFEVENLIPLTGPGAAVWGSSQRNKHVGELFTAC